jgi:hypothetical protein
MVLLYHFEPQDASLMTGIRAKIAGVRTPFFTSVTVLGDFPVYVVLPGICMFRSNLLFSVLKGLHSPGAPGAPN